jgi:uncharacterized protein
VDYSGDQSAMRFSKFKTDKKNIKKMSNAFTVPLLFEQVIGTVAYIIAAILLMFIRVSILHQGGSFNLSTFMSFISQSDNNDWLNNVFSALSYFSYMFIPFVIIAAVMRQNPLKIVPFKIKHPEFIAPAIIIGLFLSVVGEFYSQYFDYLINLFNLKVELPQFSFPSNPSGLLVYCIEISILAPICEEFIFRGMIMQNLRKYGNFFAVLVSSLLFGILHGNFEQTPFAFVVGLALGFVVIETGSILVSMLLHCCINSISIAFDALSYYKGDDFANILYFSYLIVISLLFIFTIVFLKRKGFFKGLKQRYFNDSMPVAQSIGIFAKTPGFIIFISLYSVLMFTTLQIK